MIFLKSRKNNCQILPLNFIFCDNQKRNAKLLFFLYFCRLKKVKYVNRPLFNKLFFNHLQFSNYQMRSLNNDCLEKL